MAAAIILIVLLVVLLISGGSLYLVRRSSSGEQNKLKSADVQEVAQRTEAVVVNEIGAAPIEAAELSADIKEAAKKTCFVTKVDGKCPLNYKEDEDAPECCGLADPPIPNEAKEKMKLAAEITKELIIGEMVEDALEFMVKAAYKKLGAAGRAAAREATEQTSRAAAKAAAKAGARGAAQAAAKTGVKMGEKAVKLAAALAKKVKAAVLALRTALMSIKTAVKAAAAATKAALMAAKAAIYANPIGAALFVLEMTLLAVDLIDPMGFNVFKPNKENFNTRKIIDAAMESKLENLGMKYPMPLTGADLWPRISEVAETNLALVIKKQEKEKLMKDEAFLDELNKKVLAEEPDAYLMPMREINKRVEDYKKNNKEGTQKLLFDEFVKELRNVSPSFQNDVEFRPDLLKQGYNTAVFCSPTGVSRWNTFNRHLWITNNKKAPFVGQYADRYLRVDKSNPGTLENPNMRLIKLNKPFAIQSPYNSIYYECSKRLKVKNGPNINPASYGVKFDERTGLCTYPSKFCSRFVLKPTMRTDSGISYPDCKEYPGQKGAEMVFGASLTRGYITYYNKIAGIFDKKETTQDMQSTTTTKVRTA